MPKLKTNRAAAKRFRYTGKGKVRRANAFKSHLLTHKTRKRKRSLRKPGLAAPGDARRVRVLLGKR
ncbi:MAG: 50S ribosomal protein L35 [Nitrospinota bacterium]